MNWTKKHTIIVLVILLLGLLVRLLPFLPPEINFVRHVVDDAYYLFCEADNLAHGKGLSFDGVNPTTSGRPLYIIFLAGIDLLVGRTNLPPVAYLLGVIADILTCILIVRFLRKLKLPPIAVILGLVFYISSARIIFYGVNGMETPFAILSIAVLLNLYQMEFKAGSTRIMPAIARGTTIALMMLLRLDFIFLVVPVIFYELWLAIRKHNWDWFWVGSSAGIIMLPWVWWSLATNGSLMPPSGDALTIVFAPNFTGGLSEFFERLVIFLNASNGALYLVLYPFKYTITASLVPIIFIIIYIVNRCELAKSYKFTDIIIIILLLTVCTLSFFIELMRWIIYALFALVAVYVLYKAIKSHKLFKNTVLAMTPIIIGFIGSIIFYSTIRLFQRLWNNIEGGLFISILLGALCSILIKRRFGIIYVVLIVCWVMASNVIIGVASLDKGPNPSQERFIRAAMWVRENTPPATVIASANGGIIQWYGERTLVDAAGIEDIEAYKALKAHALYDYLKKRGVQYLIDPKLWIFNYYSDFWGVNIQEKLDEVYDTDPLNLDKYKVQGTEILKSIIYRLK